MTVQLTDVLASGDLTEIKKGGPAAENEVLTVAEAAVPSAYKDFDPTASKPAELAGRVFFDEAHSAMAYYPGFADVLVQVGQEQVLKVKNITGAIITNGSVCRLAGADPVTEFPQAILAQADVFANAVMLGCATHDIGIGEFGIITIAGVIHDVDTSAYNENDILYLSDTVPGGWSVDIPDVISRVGQVLKVDATTGRILLSMESLLTVPTLWGQLEGKVASMAVTAIDQTIANWTTKAEVNITGNVTTGILVTPNTGRYRSNINVSFTVPSSISTRTLTFQVYDITDAVVLYHYHIPIPRDATEVSRSSGKPVVLDSAHEYVIQVNTDTDVTVTFDEISWDIESIFVYP